MKKVLVIVCMISLSSSLLYGQNDLSGFGGGAGSAFLFGDSNLKYSTILPNFNLFGVWQVSNRLTLKLQAGYGHLGVHYPTRTISNPILPVEITGMFSLTSSRRVNPFIHLGCGVLGFKLNNRGFYYDAMAIGGTGFHIPIGSKLTWLVSTDFRYTTGDDFNGVSGGLNDAYMNFQSGLIYSFKEKKQFKKKDTTKEKQILAQYYQAEKEVLLRTRIENLRNGLNKMEKEIQNLNKLVENHLQKLNEFSLHLYHFAVSRGASEKVKFLAVTDEEKVIQ